MTSLSNTRATVKKLHYYSGITLSVFIGLHLFNHLFALAGADVHIELMNKLRKVYRQTVIESILLLAVLIQVVSGIQLLIHRKAKIAAEKMQIYSGIYLSFFLIAHVSAVIAGRLLVHLDTNFYFAAAGLNSFPATLFFIPYYFLAVCAIGLHIASLHYLKTKSGWSAYLMGTVGVLAAALIVSGYTNFFKWRSMPLHYQQFVEQFIGK